MVEPWPGQCFAQAATPPLWSPRTQAPTCRATRCGSEPNARVPITGFAGTFTSATGARFQFTPTAASSAAIDAATLSVRARIIDDAERSAARVGAAGVPLEPRDVAAFLVDRKQDVGRSDCRTAHSEASCSREGTL